MTYDDSMLLECTRDIWLYEAERGGVEYARTLVGILVDDARSTVGALDVSCVEWAASIVVSGEG